jgi:iron complex transport system substrate-binding protein
MKMLRCLLALLAAVALGAAPPRRVVSQAVGTDDVLLALADPSQIAALSHLGHDERYAPSFREAQRFPALRNSSAEDILRFRPDLVITTSYAPAESITLLRRAGVQVYIAERFERLEDVYDNLRRIGELLGRSRQAEALIRSCRSRVEALAKRLQGAPPVRVMAAGIYPFASGSDTSFQDICDHGGALNVAAEAGLKGHVPMPTEKALTWKADVLIGPQDKGENLAAQLKDLAPYKFMPALRQGRVVPIPGALLAATSHRRIETYEWVARALHPECFR